MDKRIEALISNYDNAHKSLAQFMVKHRFLEIDKLVKTFLEFCEIYGEQVEQTNIRPSFSKKYLNQLLEKMNENLSKMGFRLVIVADEAKEDVDYIALITERNYHHSFIPVSGFSPDEISLFRMWLKLMFTPVEQRNDSTASGNRPRAQQVNIGEMPINKALNDSKTQGASLSTAQKVLNKLEQGKWIILEEDTMRLHPYAVAELEQILQREYELPSCEHCRHPIVLSRLSFRCECDSFYHVCCLKKELPYKCRDEDCDARITEENLEDFDFAE